MKFDSLYYISIIKSKCVKISTENKTKKLLEDIKDPYNIVDVCRGGCFAS